jgi:hypothetical protein
MGDDQSGSVGPLEHIPRTLTSQRSLSIMEVVRRNSATGSAAFGTGYAYYITVYVFNLYNHFPFRSEFRRSPLVIMF